MNKSRSIALLAALALGLAIAWMALHAVTNSPARLAETLANDPEPARRRYAAEALAKASDESSENALAAAVSDQDSSVRGTARNALIARKSARAIPSIAQSLNGLPPGEQLECAKVLGGTGDAAAVPVILNAARAQEKDAGRIPCIGALEKLGYVAIAPLVEALKDSNANVRSAAAGGLGALAFKMRGSDAGKVPETFGMAVEPIAALLKDAEPYVRASAADALGSLHLPSAVPGLLGALGDQDLKMQEILPRVLSYFPTEAIDPLIALLRHEEFPVRRAAAETIGEIALTGTGTIETDSPAGKAIAQCDQGLKRRNIEFMAGAYLYYIRKGQSGSVMYMIDTLNGLGDKRMAETMLNCGNSELSEAARAWAKENGYTVSERQAGSGYRWGGGK